MMRSMALTMFAAAVLAPLPSAAQSTPTASPTSAYASPKADETKTATGCVAVGVDGRTFTFTESATPAAPSTPSTVAASPAPWSLSSRSDLDLSRYVGKKVEITGSMDNKTGVSAEKSESTTRSPNATTGPRFHVKSVKVLAETCS